MAQGGGRTACSPHSSVLAPPQPSVLQPFSTPGGPTCPQLPTQATEGPAQLRPPSDAPATLGFCLFGVFVWFRSISYMIWKLLDPTEQKTGEGLMSHPQPTTGQGQVQTPPWARPAHLPLEAKGLQGMHLGFTQAKLKGWSPYGAAPLVILDPLCHLCGARGYRGQAAGSGLGWGSGGTGGGPMGASSQLEAGVLTVNQKLSLHAARGRGWSVLLGTCPSVPS